MLAVDTCALVVIDIQEKLAQLMYRKESLFESAQKLIKGIRVLEIPIVVTEQYPKGLGPTVPELARSLSGPPLVKDSFSCAREPAVRAAIEAVGRRQAVVAGIEAHVCVLQTALDLAAAGFQVHVPHDAVCSRRPVDKKWALERMAAAGVAVSTTESALFELLERCGTDEFKAVSRMIREIPV